MASTAETADVHIKQFSPALLTTPDIARLLEAVEAEHLRQQVEAYRQLTQNNNACAIPVCGGIAAFTEAGFGRKLNHVTGMGMGAVPDVESIAQLEQAYAALGLDTEIDLCTHADPGALALIARRGYVVTDFSNTYARRLDDFDGKATNHEEIEIVTDKTALASVFVTHSVAGFAVQARPRPARLLEVLAQMAVLREDSSLYLARINGEVAGSAGMSVIDTAAGKVAYLYIASTLPAYRGRGVQQSLLQARLAAAQQTSCVLACVTARPANASSRNTERAGFSLAYTKCTFVKKIHAS
ncbi:GNAT family N-acetyltransferase [Undibacterium sp. TS12]|uniref:GNAT family N-acetyltransferase n=1 Tax=Undibacterium sp. TS12 TaxID=2908202 RepID=UPI001F4D1EE7|nr:GNAT family N-acetyltransferase [Undibacterium sp. TS12]MCH8620386.1 GNAT family N-acetyltransferase [Undibacterium sp. TS12]